MGGKKNPSTAEEPKQIYIHSGAAVFEEACDEWHAPTLWHVLHKYMNPEEPLPPCSFGSPWAGPSGWVSGLVNGWSRLFGPAEFYLKLTSRCCHRLSACNIIFIHLCKCASLRVHPHRAVLCFGGGDGGPLPPAGQISQHHKWQKAFWSVETFANLLKKIIVLIFFSKYNKWRTIRFDLKSPWRVIGAKNKL